MRSHGLGNWKIAKDLVKKHNYSKAGGGPRWAPEGLQDYHGSSGRFPSASFGPSLGPSRPILSPPCPFSGGPGGHLEADVGLGRLDLGVQGGQKVTGFIDFPEINRGSLLIPIGINRDPY